MPYTYEDRVRFEVDRLANELVAKIGMNASLPQVDAYLLGEIAKLRVDIADLMARLGTMAGVTPADAHERGWQWRPTATDTAFAPPFGTIRQCRVCGCLVAGGPTTCARCAEAGA